MRREEGGKRRHTHECCWGGHTKRPAGRTLTWLPGTTGEPFFDARGTADPKLPSLRPGNMFVQSGPPYAAMSAPRVSYVFTNSFSKDVGTTTMTCPGSRFRCVGEKVER